MGVLIIIVSAHVGSTVQSLACLHGPMVQSVFLINWNNDEVCIRLKVVMGDLAAKQIYHADFII